jgi:hypothetical protein
MILEMSMVFRVGSSSGKMVSFSLRRQAEIVRGGKSARSAKDRISIHIGVFQLFEEGVREGHETDSAARTVPGIANQPSGWPSN